MPVPARIARRYYAYRATTAIGFYLPVGVAYLTEVKSFGLDSVGFVMAAYLVAMLAAEIPTGYLGDRLGRRASLAVGNAMMAGSLVAWTLLDSPVEYAALNVVWATGTTFRSGTADAWLYELLAAHDASDEYARVSGRATTVRLVVSAGSAAAAGGLAALDWTYPFLANAALAALGLPLLVALPSVARERADDAFAVRDAARTLGLQARRPEVRWFVAYAALFYGLFQLAMVFEQPALRAVGVPVAGLGVLYAGFKLVSAGAASLSGRLRDRFGIRGVFALYAPLVGATFAAVAVVPVLLVPALFLVRGSQAATRPLRNQYLNDRLGDVGRATVLSGASMVLSLVGATASFVGGQIASVTGPVQFLTGAGLAAAGGAGVLWLAVSPVRSEHDAASTPGDPAAAE
jgi:MFS family permease